MPVLPKSVRKEIKVAGKGKYLRLRFQLSSLGILEKDSLNGLSAFTNYAVGNTPETGSTASPDRREWDITVDYRPPFELLNGFWLRMRRARVWEERPNKNDLFDYRIIINY